MAIEYVQFGPSKGVDSKDYILHMSNPDGVTGKPFNLLGHSLTPPSPNLTEALVFTKVVQRNGVVTVEEYVKRAAYETSRTYTIGIPSSLLTPVSEKSFGKGCEATFYLIYQCPEDPIYDHFDILPNGVLSPAVEAEDLITTTAESNIITQTSELRVPRRIRGWALGWGQVYKTSVDTVALNDVFYIAANCAGCSEGVALNLIATGGDGTAVPVTPSTVNRFSSITARATGIATDIGQAGFNNGLVTIIATRTGATLAAATAGKLFISSDNVNFTQITGFIGVVTRIIEAGGTIIAMGKDATNAAIWLSSDGGASFTLITSVLLSAGLHINDASYDAETGRIYFVGTGSTFLVGRLLGGTLTLNDLEINLPATAPGILFGVKVLGINNLMIVGATAYIVESRNGGLTFFRVTAGTGDVTALDGDQNRQVIGQGINFYVRDASTKGTFKLVILQNGEVVTAASVITRIRMNLENDINRFVAVTSKGQVIFGKPFYPGA